MKNVVIYHNPACGTSRNTLALIRAAGIEPEVIEYLRDPPTRERLLELIAMASLTARDEQRGAAVPACGAGVGNSSTVIKTRPLRISDRVSGLSSSRVQVTSLPTFGSLTLQHSTLRSDWQWRSFV